MMVTDVLPCVTGMDINKKADNIVVMRPLWVLVLK
jgi:hypothetical protein